MRLRGFLAALWLGAVPPGQVASRLAPVSQFHDLVAGNGVAGFENGPFYRARFRGPLGLAVLEKKGALAVSDRGNDRIRVVWLDQNDRVDTLAGSGIVGSADGPLQLASFNEPQALVAVSDHGLVVNDEGNHLFRLIDLEKARVETLAGNGSVGVEAGAAREVPLGGVWALAYAPAENAIYFTQPELGALRVLDLRSRAVRTILRDDPRIPHPAALAFFQGKLRVADREGQAWTLQAPVPDGAKDPPQLMGLNYGKGILAMAATANRLYALQRDPSPAWVCVSTREDVAVADPWGAMPRVPYLRLPVDEPVGFVPDPRAGESFFVASSAFNAILCLKEYRFRNLQDPGGIAASGLVDFEYPARKPAKTFRILLLGDSRMNMFDMTWGEPAPTPLGKAAAIAKRLELMLNTLAALDGVATRFEVLSLTQVSAEPLLVWPISLAAPVVKKFDIDLVLLMLPPFTSTVEAYLQRPIAADGIPASAIDPEYLLQPLAARMKGNPARALLEGCRARGFGQEGRFVPGEWEQCGTPSDSPQRSELLALMSRPLSRIPESLKSSRPGGKSPVFQVCYFGTGPRGAGVIERGFWKELCAKLAIPWLDLLDPLIAVSDSWYPMSETPGALHFDRNGHAVFAFVLAHELIRKGVVPLGTPASAGLGSIARGAPRLAPISHYHDLVAGSGVAGFENGAFTRASFRDPLGLAVLAKPAALAVADRGNDRIRVVQLEQNNRVDTLAGSGLRGRADGPLATATFNGPTSLAAVSDHSLIVNDEGNHLFRLVDVATGMVETVAGNGSVGTEDGPARRVGVGSVWNLAYVAAENAVYFSQPELGLLRRLDLGTRTIATVLRGDSRLPRPAALALFRGRLCVADADGPVWALSLPAVAGAAELPLQRIANGKGVLAMAASESELYALQTQPEPAWICLSNGQQIDVPGAWGEVPRAPYLQFRIREPVAFVPDPREGRSFFLASSQLDAVLCLKEYRFQELRVPSGIARSGLVDFEYPESKPRRTFRILLLGDSRMNSFDVPLDAALRELTPRPMRMATIPKRLELLLNTMAALDGSGNRYEVLSVIHNSWEPLLVWPNYEAAALVKKFDVDLVLLMLPPETTTVDAYLQRPVGKNGIPGNEVDAEYLLEPLSKRLLGNPAAPLIARCRELGIVFPGPEKAVDWETCGSLPESPGRSELLALVARPLAGIRDSLRSSKPDGGTPAFRVCYFATGIRGAGVLQRPFWKELCESLGIAWLDLLDPLIAVADSWYPLTEEPGSRHYTANGHLFFSLVLAHELIAQGIVPLGRVVAEAPAAPAALALLAMGGLIAARRPRRPGRNG